MLKTRTAYLTMLLAVASGPCLAFERKSNHWLYKPLGQGGRVYTTPGLEKPAISGLPQAEISADGFHMMDVLLLRLQDDIHPHATEYRFEIDDYQLAVYDTDREYIKSNLLAYLHATPITGSCHSKNEDIMRIKLAESSILVVSRYLLSRIQSVLCESKGRLSEG